MTPETRQKIMWDEHDQRWTPPKSDPQGRVQYVPAKTRLAATMIARPGEEPDYHVDATAFKDNPGPGARWCRNCQAWVSDGLAVIRRTGTLASEADYTAHCPNCEGRLSR